MVEGDADAAPAEEGVFFLDREVGQRLVATNIQGAHGHRQRVEGGELLAVDRQLLLFAGEAVVDHERHFRAVQTDAFGAALLGASDVRQQAGVDPQRHAMAVQRLAGQFAQSGEALAQLLFFSDHFAVLLDQLRRRVGIDFAMVAIDDQVDAIDLGIRQVDRAHDGRDTHGAGEDGDVGVARTEHRDQAGQLAFRHFAEHRRRQFLADDDGLVRIGQGLLPLFLQVGEDAPADVLDVGGALAQVGVVHQFEALDVLHHHLAQGALGPLAGADDALHFEADGSVVEHHQVDVEQRALFLAQLARQLAGEVAHVFTDRLQRLLEQLDLGLDVVDRLVRHHFQVGRRQHHHRLAHGDAGRARHADELGFGDALAGLAQAADRTGRLGVGDDPGELRAHGHQEGFLALVELAFFLLLHDQDAHHPAVVDDRRAEEGGVALLAGLGEVAVARVFGGVLQVERFLAAADQADQALVRRHAHLADGALVQAIGRHQHEAVGVRIQQIDRADLRPHRLLDALHDDAQRRLEILGGVDFLDDLTQRVEHGSGSNSLICLG
ncbi:hypothetical protein D3C76_750860 [compost metagenome]